ncbi:TetR/AcrR family transcriptional regulator [Streptomyces paludis]|uniref:TetR/AcrR family transcriptional regulator n=1 Tax=Streptomyces paludis TaxID=2282738 RepID=A0A345HQX3_9ACTN|nr:helix-turn-helix domain-containing protein [Streptomyces paludis]AXG79097.1 TetR/AcrR family transcriptional regulator [Streptomyces paludis]
MTDVKGKRALKARETRRRMLGAALGLFVERGYGATTLKDIAERAGVAVQTLYFTFGNKRALLKELVDVTIAGDDEPVATMDRPWFRAALAAPTAEEQLRLHVAGTGAILARVAPLLEVVSAAAATDAEVAAEWPRGSSGPGSGTATAAAGPDPRFTVQSAAAGALVGKPGIRAGVAAPYAADVLYGLLSTELYLLLTRDRGWAPEVWERWVFETLRGQLCGGGGPEASPSEKQTSEI